LVLAALLSAGGDPAQAVVTAPVISEVTVTPDQVVLPASDGRKASVEIRMHVKSSAGIDSVVAGLYGPSSGSGKAVRLARSSGSAVDGVWRAKAALPSSSMLGQWRVQAFAVDKAQRSSDANQIYTAFEVRTPTRLVPFTVTWTDDGSRVRVAATLERWQSGHGWLGQADADVIVEFRATGAKDFALVDTARTAADGSIVASPTSDVTVGTWRLRYAGDELSAPAASAEVAVAPPPSSTSPTPAPTEEPSNSPSAVPLPSASPVSSAAPGASATPRPSSTATPFASHRPTTAPATPDTPHAGAAGYPTPAPTVSPGPSAAAAGTSARRPNR
jgi:hypothetical protein